MQSAAGTDIGCCLSFAFHLSLACNVTFGALALYAHPIDGCEAYHCLIFKSVFRKSCRANKSATLSIYQHQPSTRNLNYVIHLQIYLHAHMYSVIK